MPTGHRSVMQALVGMALLASSPALASDRVALGEIRIDSLVGEPLSAEIALPATVPPDVLEQWRVELASEADYRSRSLHRSSALQGLRVELLTEEDLLNEGKKRTRLQITSREPVRESFFNLLFKVSTAQGSHFRHYPVLLDSYRSSQSGRNSVIATEGSRAGRAERFYGPVQADDNLRTVAQRVMADLPSLNGLRPSHNQVMAALWSKNRSQFRPGNMDTPVTGALLQIPTVDEIMARSEQEALSLLNQFKRSSVRTTPVAAAKVEPIDGVKPPVKAKEKEQKEPTGNKNPVVAAPAAAAPQAAAAVNPSAMTQADLDRIIGKINDRLDQQRREQKQDLEALDQKIQLLSKTISTLQTSQKEKEKEPRQGQVVAAPRQPVPPMPVPPMPAPPSLSWRELWASDAVAYGGIGLASLLTAGMMWYRRRANNLTPKQVNGISMDSLRNFWPLRKKRSQQPEQERVAPVVTEPEETPAIAVAPEPVAVAPQPTITPQPVAAPVVADPPTITALPVATAVPMAKAAVPAPVPVAAPAAATPTVTPAVAAAAVAVAAEAVVAAPRVVTADRPEPDEAERLPDEAERLPDEAERLPDVISWSEETVADPVSMPADPVVTGLESIPFSLGHDDDDDDGLGWDIGSLTAPAPQQADSPPVAKALHGEDEDDGLLSADLSQFKLEFN
ncbi:MAG: hypothetical protein HQL58_10820 [Magnetococcales bacterium]|nr:hypothetical protein [Magnetococcales bacterium]